jgi:DNA-binding response OmpR family regulator
LKRFRILFVERRRASTRPLLEGLRQQYAVSLVHGRRDALSDIDGNPPDLILVDVPSIRFDLERFCKDAKTLAPTVLFFFLLGKGMRLDQLPHTHGHLRHPLTPRQLLGRLARVLPKRDGEVICWRGLELYVSARSLGCAGREVLVTPKQALLAAHLLRSPEETLTRAQLMEEVWGTDYLGDTRTLDVHIHWLRKALRTLKAPVRIETERGVGYRLVDGAVQ